MLLHRLMSNGVRSSACEAFSVVQLHASAGDSAVSFFQPLSCGIQDCAIEGCTGPVEETTGPQLAYCPTGRGNSGSHYHQCGRPDVKPSTDFSLLYGRQRQVYSMLSCELLVKAALIPNVYYGP